MIFFALILHSSLSYNCILEHDSILNKYIYIVGNDTIILSKESISETYFPNIQIDTSNYNEIYFGKLLVNSLDPFVSESIYFKWNDSLQTIAKYYLLENHCMILDSNKSLDTYLYKLGPIIFPEGGYFTYFQKPQLFSCKKIVIYYLVVNSKWHYFTSYDNSSTIIFEDIIKQKFTDFNIKMLLR